MFASKKAKVGIVGLGIVGSRVADRLRNNDYDVRVWNRTPRAGEPLFIGKLEDLVSQVNVIEIFVSDGKALLSVIETMSSNLGRQHTVINHATVDLESVLGANKIVTSAGAVFFDAPFTGSKVAAERGSLVYYLSGENKLDNNIRNLLEVSATEIIEFKNLGDGMVLKVATNLLAAGSLQLLGEALNFIQSYNVDPKSLAEVLPTHGVNSKLFEMKLPTILADDFEPHFALKNMLKDVKIGCQMAKKVSTKVPLAQANLDIMKELCADDLAEEDFSIVSKLAKKL